MLRMLSRVVLVFLIFPIAVLAALTVHIQNPWEGDAAFEAPLRVYGGAGSGWDAGSAKTMTDDGDGFWSYTYPATVTKATNENVNVTYFAGGTSWGNPSSNIWNIPSFFTGSLEGQVDVWVEVHPGGGYKSHYFKPMDSIVVNLLNPFPATSPKLVFQGAGSPEQMTVLGGGYDGWYTKKLYFYTDETDVTVKFTDYFEAEWYTSIGRGDGAAIDISAYRNGTVWIYPEPYPYGPATVTATYPTGVVGTNSTRTLTALVRDWNGSTDNSFQNGFASDVGMKNLAADDLGANGKILKGANASALNFQTDDMPSWFKTVVTPSGVENDTCIELEMTKGYDGSWEYTANSSNGGFYPINSFNPWNENLAAYNNYNPGFTMELHTQFEYYAGKGQVFSFDGDDDVWVYINGKLAIDLGGPHPQLSGSVNLDAIAGTYGLVDGGTYNLDMFYCERQVTAGQEASSANFRMKMNFDLRTNFSLLYNKTTSGSEEIYTIEQLTPSGTLQDDICGYNVYDTAFDTTVAMVQFTLEGPSVNPAQVLGTGEHYGGIRVIGGPSGDSSIAIDTSQIAGLTAGVYTVRYVSTLDATQEGSFTFEVVKSLSALDIVALPGAGTSFWGDTTVLLSVIRDGLDTVSSLTSDSIDIYYTVNGVMPDSSNLSAATLYTGPVLIDADATIRVLAMGTDMIADTATFAYTRNYKTAQLLADPPSGTTFIGSQGVDLYVVIDGETFAPDTTDTLTVWWSQDGSYPDISDSSQLYTSTSNIRVSDNDTIYAIVATDNILPDSAMFTYTREYYATNLWAVPDSGTRFGDSLQIELFSDAENIFYLIGDFVPDTSDASQRYTGAIDISGVPGDTVTLTALAYGEDYTLATKTFVYYRDYAPAVIATPGDTTFVDSLYVSLSFEATMLENVLIYYTLDGTEPTDSTGQLYMGPIVVDSSTQIHARAYADSARSGEVSSWSYRRIFGATGGVFYDRDANGLIDEVVLELAGMPGVAPEELRVVNPFDRLDTVVVTGSAIVLDDSIVTVSLSDEPFESASTEILSGDYVQFVDTAYVDSWVSVEDGVAPVVVSAKYYYGGGPVDSRVDTLEVALSEIFTPAMLSMEPFLLWDIGGAEVSLELVQEDVTSTEVVRLLVTTIERSISRDDSLSINPLEGVADGFGNVQDVDNVRRPITIYPAPVRLKLSTLSPFVPLKTELPRELVMEIEKGTAVVVDFQSDLSVVDIDVDLEYELVVFDRLGNLISRMNGDVQNAVTGAPGVIEQHPSEHPNVNVGMITVGGKTQLVLTWNGLNYRNRVVAPGMYAIFMRMRLLSGGEVLAEFEEEQDYLGVKLGE